MRISDGAKLCGSKAAKTAAETAETTADTKARFAAILAIASRLNGRLGSVDRLSDRVLRLNVRGDESQSRDEANNETRFHNILLSFSPRNATLNTSIKQAPPLGRGENSISIERTIIFIFDAGARPEHSSGRADV